MSKVMCDAAKLIAAIPIIAIVKFVDGDHDKIHVLIT